MITRRQYKNPAKESRMIRLLDKKRRRVFLEEQTALEEKFGLRKKHPHSY